jgi:hypothetical protein
LIGSIRFKMGNFPGSIPERLGPDPAQFFEDSVTTGRADIMAFVP